MLWDANIREQLIHLLQELCPQDHILEELPLGRLRVRADVVKVSDNALVGYEIKSDADSLVRLGGQVKGYDAIFDLSFLVTTEKYFLKAAQIIPPHWGILVSYDVNGDITIVEHRPARTHDRVRDNRRLEFLWREDLLRILHEKKLDRGIRSKPKKVLRKVLFENVSSEEIARMISVKLRTRWRFHYDEKK